MSTKIFKKETDCEKLIEHRMNFKNYLDYDIPFIYICDQDTFIGYDESNNMIGGFTLIKNLEMSRTWAQCPSFAKERFLKTYEVDDSDCCEFTFYWLKDKSFGFWFTFNLVKTILFYPKKYFIFSFDQTKKRLKNYYDKGDPVYIYSGPVRIDGLISYEYILAVSKFGIFKIFLSRTLKIFLKKRIKE